MDDLQFKSLMAANSKLSAQVALLSKQVEQLSRHLGLSREEVVREEVVNEEVVKEEDDMTSGEEAATFAPLTQNNTRPCLRVVVRSLQSPT